MAAKYRTPTLYSAPPVALALAKHPMVAGFDLSCVERFFSGAAPLGGEVGDAVAERLGCLSVQGYGMTEMSPVSHATPRGQARKGSVGLTLPSTECRIVVDGRDAEPGEAGELWVRGPQVMVGYHNRPEATASTLTEDGWLKTGDLAEIDGDGFVFIRDRLKELIKVKGFQVAPAEVEAALLTSPMVKDAAVRGVPDDEAGEVPVAFVVPAEGAEEGAIRAHLAGSWRITSCHGRSPSSRRSRSRPRARSCGGCCRFEDCLGGKNFAGGPSPPAKSQAEAPTGRPRGVGVEWKRKVLA